MMQSLFTQIIKNQESKILEVFTPDYVIETSKVISIVKQQDSVIKARDIQISEYKDKVFKLEKEYKETLIKIIKEKNNIVETVNEVEKITTDKYEKHKSRVSGYIGTEVPELSFETPNINIELVYDIKRLGVGVKTEFQTATNRYRYYFNIRYKFL